MKGRVIIPKIKWLIWILSFVFSACATYHPKPLSKQAAIKQIATPNFKELSIEASYLKHPVLRPVPLNFKDGVNIEEAAILGVLLNPHLRAIRAERKIAWAELMRAGLLPNPELSFDIAPPLSKGPGLKSPINLELNWELSALLRRKASIREARENTKRVALDIAWQEWLVAERVKQHYLKAAMLEELVTLGERQVKISNQAYKLAKAAINLGEKTQPALLASDLSLSTAQSTLSNYKQLLQRERQALNYLMGLPPDYYLRLQRTNRPFTLPKSPFDAKALFEQATSQRLDLLAFAKAYQCQEARLQQAVLGQFPRLRMGPAYERNEEGQHFLGIGLAIELPIFNHNQAAIKRETAIRKRLRLEYINRVYEIRAKIYAALQKFQSEKAASNFYRRQIDKLSKAIQIEKGLLQTGSGSIWDVIRERKRLLEVQASYIQSKSATYQALLELEAFYGRPLTNWN